ncbi:hypothetical protein [Micromonospora sp. AMSO31t]|uniref:hypothetical protein n=1 Tax=Micromonospora sp. AMSO31t TaxID=2650566 RepID=UPI00124B2C47|nr:hypothetical protein [Micromonospora sp. AMSO31t]KAB1909761.1 hypothetical protein F8274_21660 [Micromonospora sp. AMSO31t]
MLVDVSQEVICRNPVLRSDAAVLVGLLAELEGRVWADLLPREFVDKVQARFVRAGHLPQAAGDYELRQALNDMNHPMRYALGEYDAPPQPTELPR